MTTLYRLFGAKGDLLYVGIAERWTSRLRQHAGDKAWLGDVRRVDLEQFCDRRAAMHAERLAIIKEHPRHNVVHNRRTPRSALASRVGSYWTCEACQLPIRGRGQGYLTAVRRLDDEWHVWHRACDPHPGDPGYWIDCADAADKSRIELWVDHLSRKVWFRCEAWGRMERRHWHNRQGR